MADDFDARYTAYQTDRSALRKMVRRAYLRSARAQLRGPTLDFGCGIGELLTTLPPGSRGLEYNAATVDYCRAQGLAVDAYDGNRDDWGLSALPEGQRFQSMVISHVLEHLDAPMAVLNRLLQSAQARGIGRVLVIVPGRAGFRIDATHRTFVDRAMLSGGDVVAGTHYYVSHSRYFPLDLARIGDWFPHHELQVLFEREGR